MDIRRIMMFPSGTIQVPSSKSIAHRALICAALAHGVSEIQNLTDSEDICATIGCMRALGATIEQTDNHTMVKGGSYAPDQPLDCGESGTTLRLLIPLLSHLTEDVMFTGRGRLMARPISPYLDVLGRHGVTITSQDNMLRVTGRLSAGLFALRGDISSQFISGLLLALPLLANDSVIQLTTPLQSASYVDLTIDMMERFGVRVERQGYDRFTVPGGQCYRPCSLTVEGDYSQAAFFLIAGALGCRCSCAGLSPTSRQGDRRIIELLEKSGVQIEHDTQGGLTAHPNQLLPQTVDAGDIPDLVPPLAALFACCPGQSHILNAGRLRHKESDRLIAIASAINALGGHIIVEQDGLTIHGKPNLRGGQMDSFHDHRIAMMGAVAAIRCEETVIITNSGCVAKSYPKFWQDFERIPKEA